MSLDIFTTQIAQNGHAPAHGKTMKAAKGTDGAGLRGLNFFDFFLQTSAQALEKEQSGKQDSKALALTEVPEEMALDSVPEELQAPASENSAEGDIANLIPADSSNNNISGEMTPTVSNVDAPAIDLENIEGGDLSVSIAQDNSEQSQDDLSIQNALMIEDKIARPALFHLQRFIQKIDALIESESPALSALNITPDQLTELKEQLDTMLERLENGEKLRDILNGEGIEENAGDFGGIFAGLIQLLPPKAKQLQGPMIPAAETGARLNNMVVGVNTANFASPQADGMEWDSTSESFQQILKGAKGEKAGDLEQILSNAGKEGKANNMIGMENALKNGQTAQLKGWPFSLGGSLFAPMSYSEGAYDELGIPLGNAPQATSLSPLTSLVMQSQSAGQAHPGTQIVAASIKKMAGSGETKNIRIQLDPPELGRVEIKMSFNKDKTVKAILTAEKPETFMMMQRDVQLLERALQNAGIDADGSELSFELAQDDQDFGQDGSHDGSRNDARGQGGEDENEEIIESTMTWHVDPDTGHMRYDILA
ncbi:MAG: flagellar hook-length control protein FliK [Alphaproteobacteria bacterium]